MLQSRASGSSWSWNEAATPTFDEETLKVERGAGMPDMYDCEVKLPWMHEGKKVMVWKVRSVEALETGTHRGARCKHCQGEVRVHKQQVPEGPGDHVEHTSRD